VRRHTFASRAATVAATVTATVAVAAAAACGAGAGAADASDRLRVVAAFYPLEFVAERVGGDRVSVTGLASPGADAHEWELAPSQVAAIDSADLVIYLSGFQPSVEGAVAEYAPEAFDATGVVPLLTSPESGPEAGDGARKGDGEDDHGGGHGTGSTDPHVWLDPDRLATITGAVAERLSVIDPDHAGGYAARAEALRADLAAMDAAYAGGLAGCQRREIVVSHAAFGYLADRYGLRQIAISGLAPEDEPTPQQVAAVVEQAREHGATTVFSEVLAGPEVAELIAEQLGAATATLDPIEGLAPSSREDYLSLMRANLATLREGLACP
jgi:zinc transport system substrate-binding protein